MSEFSVGDRVNVVGWDEKWGGPGWNGPAHVVAVLIDAVIVCADNHGRMHGQEGLFVLDYIEKAG